ncbi:MAG: arginase [Thermonemataceae bacterium]|nr:arginase [Thermonemataceae bacterium]
MKCPRIIEIKSEIGAGTRGASLGIDALKIASLKKNDNFFYHCPTYEVRTFNESLFEKTPYLKAKRIDYLLKTLQNVSDAVSQSLLAEDFPIILAGDHSTAAGTIAGIKKTMPNKRLGVIWIDAHADLHSPYTTPSGNMHGMPLAMALAEDNLDAKINDVDEKTEQYWHYIKSLGVAGAKLRSSDIVFIALRDTEAQEDYLIEKYQMPIYTVEHIRKKGIKASVQEILEDKLKDCDLLYVSFDVDSLDEHISVGTGTPVADGLSVEEATLINQLLMEDDRIVAWEMVEINPTLDNKGNVMAETAFDILKICVNSLNQQVSKEAIEV